MPFPDAMHYRPGLHILSEITCSETNLLVDYTFVKDFFFEKIAKYALHPVGDVFHGFEGGGYTGIICLTESHLAIHTWPEFGIITFDIFLSNFSKSNDEVARKLFADTVAFFKSKKYTHQEVSR